MGKRASQPRESVWLSPRPARKHRAGESELDREKIVATAVRVLDAEGDAKFSMRLLAEELNVTPMSVYWYVANKDDLLELALDAVAGEIELPSLDDGNDWREDLRALARAWRRTMVAHPWAIRCYGEYLNIGPSSLRFTECAQAVMACSPLPLKDRSAALNVVFQYVYGFTATESRWLEHLAETGRTAEEFAAEVTGSMAAMSSTLEQGGLLERDGDQSMEQLRDRDFDRGLNWLFTGMVAGG
ncbi:TetR family transcriptional regulator [Amycolatopsis mediterranei S699]|uniref:TetR family transcriptional regulator n=3 Tax=Amycolatopsis mediterranei TaxID=33910 RepID=A0A0H3CWZ6_AMYMU|nr:TetR/AcrR family transcriptional regulator [Amycolatopsis mediterranei]AAC01726.1 RifQ [Amycolatopsis mediterranei S699]ADJ42454.1 TetR family transcriptional regulator [Amycolatopsis mediterranei U32]AEK39140.1 TetR family transcriptional regulator [Amycolatopsis mediterranei S699]AFO74168.1 TetR family transcriptional regulator [Amycolatopsis mediterranei S699]AGT81297.1 TetR family transcriptional regulator [Amycolatopsis mediterranei RB]